MRSTLATFADLIALYDACVHFEITLQSRLQKYHNAVKVCGRLLKDYLFPNLRTSAKHIWLEVYDFILWLNKELMNEQDVSCILSNMRKRGKLVRYLGKGSLFEVHEMRTFFFDTFARKSLRKKLPPHEHAEAEEILRSEAAIWKHLQQHPHHHIAKLRADHTAHSPPFLDFYHVGEMDLNCFLTQHLIDSSEKPLLKKQLMGWFGCLRNTVQHLHEQGHVLHNDIKAKNLILRQDHLELIDFSTSRVLTPDSGFTCSERTNNSPLFKAPECEYLILGRVSVPR